MVHACHRHPDPGRRLRGPRGGPLVEFHKLMLSLAALAIIVYSSLFAWYEGSGSRAEVDAAYRDYYDDEWQQNETKTIRYWGRIGICDGLADPTDCDAVRNGSAKRDTAGFGGARVYERDPVTFFALHMGAIMGLGLFWALSLTLLVIGSTALLALADSKWPNWWQRGIEGPWLHLLRQGFLLVWLLLLGLIWVLAWHVVTR